MTDLTARTNCQLKLHSPTDLLVELPALIGFVPDESFVAVLLDRGTVRCTMRMDLDDDLTEAAIRTIGVAHRAEADEVVTVTYTRYAGGDLPLQWEVGCVVDLLEEQGIAVRDNLLVDRDRWWSYACINESCCPPNGNPLPDRTPVLEAERVATGRTTIAASRENAAAAFTVDPGRELPEDVLAGAQVALEALTGTLRAEYALEALTTLCSLHEAPEEDSAVDEDLATSLQAVVALSLQDLHVRDYLLGHSTNRWSDLAAPSDALVQTALVAPPSLRPQVAATAMGLLAADGSNAVALWCMADLSEGESLSQLVRAGVEAGFPPNEIRALFAAVLPEVNQRLANS